MRDWLAELAGPQYVEAILWTLGALAALAVLLLVVRLARGVRGGTFVAGGRNRRTRLAVMDATAVDTHRRLVLVRRDDVEHLLLIGGPTDLVVEQDIRVAGQRRPAPREPMPDVDETPALPPAPAQPVEAPRLAMRPSAAPPAGRNGSPPGSVAPAQPREFAGAPALRAPAPVQLASPGPRPAPARSEPRPPLGRPEPPRQEAPRPVHPPSPARPAPLRPSEPDDMDEALMRELEVSFDQMEPARPATPAKGASGSLDDEMTKLLGELSGGRR